MSDHAKPGRGITDPKVRRYVYLVAVALGPVVLFYGLMSTQEILVWAGFLQTLLGLSNGLALANTPGGKE